MRKVSMISLVFGLTLLLGVGTALAGKLSGPHYQFNIVGHPKNVECIGGDDSNGRAIMVPLRNVGGPSDLVCDEGPGGGQTVFVDDIKPKWSTQEPAGAKIYFQCGDTFQIIDRDAFDGAAKIQVECYDQQDPLFPDDPTKVQQVIGYDVYMRVLGKPSTCMNITGYAYQEDLDHSLWFETGTVYLNRSTGKSTFVKVTGLFDVWWCDVREVLGDGIGNENGKCEINEDCDCVTAPILLSVFNDIFDEYFWNIINDGTRLVQVRLYPRFGTVQ